jgi:hypothetical protein
MSAPGGDGQMMRLLKRLLSVTREMIREQAKVMKEADKTEFELDRSLRRTSKSKSSRSKASRLDPD